MRIRRRQQRFPQPGARLGRAGSNSRSNKQSRGTGIIRVLRPVLPISSELLGSAAAVGEDARDEIRIGQALPYSGPASGFGIIGRAQEAYFEKINTEGGINGRKVK